MTSPGEELKKEREGKGISLAEIASTTRVSLQYLEALENDKLQLLPGPFFIRAIIRTYAKSVGLDEEETLKKYARAGLLQPEETASHILGKVQAGLTKWQKILFSALGLVVIALICFAIYVVFKPGNGRSGSESAPVVSPPPSSKATIQTLAASPPAEPKVLESASKPEEGLSLKLTFKALTWIQVYADGRLVLDGLKPARAGADIEARGEILIHLGNAGGVDALLNGKKAKSFGRSGAVVKDIRITRDNLKDFLAEAESGAEQPES